MEERQGERKPALFDLILAQCTLMECEQLFIEYSLSSFIHQCITVLRQDDLALPVLIDVVDETGYSR